MAKVFATYRAVHGDSKVVEWGGFTFFDGIPVEIERNETNAHMIGKLATNRFFELSETAHGNAQPQAAAPEDHESEPESGEPQAEEEETADDTADDTGRMTDAPAFMDYKPEAHKRRAAPKPKSKHKRR